MKDRKFKATLDIIQAMADSVSSINMLGWPKNYLGFEFNAGFSGLGGLISGLISAYKIYPARQFEVKNEEVPKTFAIPRPRHSQTKIMENVQNDAALQSSQTNFGMVII